MSSNGGSAQPGSPRRGRLGLFERPHPRAHRALGAPSRPGGLTRDRPAAHPPGAPHGLRGAHLRRASGRREGEETRRVARPAGAGTSTDARHGGVSGARSPPPPRSPRIPCRPVSSYAKPTNRPFARPDARAPAPRDLQDLLCRAALRRRLNFKLIFSVATFARVVERRHEGDPAWTSHLQDRGSRRHSRYDATSTSAIPALIYLVENHVRFVVLKRARVAHHLGGLFPRGDPDRRRALRS